jgi:hypothetical protein
MQNRCESNNNGFAALESISNGGSGNNSAYTNGWNSRSINQYSMESSSSALATEGWLELFLSPSQKATFAKWHETINDKSLTHKATNNLFNILSKRIPDTVAPNVITAAGFLSLGQAWYVTNLYGTYIKYVRQSTCVVYVTKNENENT